MSRTVLPGESLRLPHIDFVDAWRAGKLRVSIDPAAAETLVSTRLLLPLVAAAVIGLGIGLTLWGWLWTGFAVGVAGVLGPRAIKRSAAGFLLAHLGEDAALYEAALECGALRCTPTRCAM